MHPHLQTPVPLTYGDFVRVRSDLDDPAAGADGMVMDKQDATGNVGVMFAYDRYNEAQRYGTGLIELWHIGELDLTSVERRDMTPPTIGRAV